MLIHNGFNESAYAYCDSCGRVALLELLGQNHTERIQGHGPLEASLVARLPACTCGGRFATDATPRCPGCRTRLDPVSAATYVERDAPGTQAGWRWSRTWSGIESFSVAENPLEHQRAPDGTIRRV